MTPAEMLAYFLTREWSHSLMTRIRELEDELETRRGQLERLSIREASEDMRIEVGEGKLQVWPSSVAKDAWHVSLNQEHEGTLNAEAVLTLLDGEGYFDE